MKKWLIALIVMLGFAASANAQSFGVRLIGAQYNTFDPGKGTGLQIAVSTFFFGSIDLEVNYLLGRIDLSDDNKFTFYYGAGAHAGFGLGVLSGGFGVGAHGVLGLEYLLQPTLSFGVSVHPGLTFVPGLSGMGFSPIVFYYGGLLFLNFKI
jgi:hypothetical protein